MSNLFVGVVLGVFVGIGLTAVYLAMSEKETRLPKDAWIDEAIERAFEAVDSPLQEA